MRWRSVLILAAILAAGIGIGLGLRVLRLQKISTSLRWVVPAPDFRAGRAIYPFSLIPGGVRNSYELYESISRDPALAEHYRDIRPAAMFPLRLTMDLEGYVSYRIGGKVFWTSHLVHIRKGELVLTDGLHIIRGRCGNQIVPAYLRPKGIPTTLDPMMPPPAIFESGYPPIMDNPPNQAVLAELGPPPLPALPATPGAAPPAYWPPAIPPVGWCCSGSTTTGTPPPVPPTGGGGGFVPPPVPPPTSGGGGGDTPPPGPPPPPATPPVVPPAAVPEPGTWLLLASGVATLGILKKWRA